MKKMYNKKPPFRIKLSAVAEYNSLSNTVPSNPPLVTKQFTFITVCKGRLAHLQQTLPTWLKVPNCEWIVVDVACPQQTAAWVHQHHPQVHVALLTDGLPFSLARSRNFGATHARTNWLCFIDADIVVQPSFATFLESQAWQAGTYMRVLDPCKTLSGTCLSQRTDFNAVGGYDEVLCGWGGEDRDFYANLERHGCRPLPLNPRDFQPIPHDDHLRTEFYEIRRLPESQSLHQIYIEIKQDLQKLRGEKLALSERKILYQKLQQQVLTAWRRGQPALLEFPWREQSYWNHSRVTKVLKYQFLPPPAPPHPF
jgi:glycosyltransferase involved in cell wall biosynthesis